MTEERRRAKDRKLVELIPVLLLSLVAVVQIFLATGGSGLSPWVGGGFGMFSTLDDPGAREVRVTLVQRNVRRVVDLAGVMADGAERAAALPTAARLERLAAVAARDADPRDGELMRVEVVVWRRSVERKTLRTTNEIFRAISFDRFPGAGESTP